MNPFAPLRDRNFVLYFGGQAASMMGMGVSLISLNWYVLDRTGSARDVSLIFAVQLGAALVALPLGGPLIDRYPRRRVAVAADLARLLTMATLAGLVAIGKPPLAAVYLLTFLTGLGHAFFWPSIMALIQEIIPPARITAASGLSEVTFQVGNLTGAALAGPFYVRFGLGWAAALDAATYAVSAAALGLVRYVPLPRPEHAAFGALVRGGMAYLRERPAVATFGVVATVPFIATLALNIVMVAFVLDTLHRTATTYGLLDMTYGVGALASGFLAALAVLRFGDWTVLTAAMAAVAAVYASLALSPTALPVVFALVFVAGFGSSSFRVVANAALLRLVAKPMMGRTGAAFSLVSTGLQVAVALAVGPLIDGLGTGAAFAMLAAVVAGGLVLLTALVPALRRRAEDGEASGTAVA